MNLGTHKAVFRWTLKQLAREGLLSGKDLGVDGTTLEANAALKSIVRRDDGVSYDEHVTQLMKAEGIEEPAPAAVYANRRRLNTKTAEALMRRRGELIERSFAHLYDTGGMRRVHLRKKTTSPNAR